MNLVCLVGRLADRPRVEQPSRRWHLRLAVDRRLPSGLPEPGVVYVDASIRWLDPDELAQFEVGVLVAIIGMIDVDEEWHGGVVGRRHRVVAESVERLTR